MRTRDILISTLFLGSFLGIARADIYQDFNRYLAQHDYVSMPVSRSGTNNEIVTAAINGKKVSLLVDTGCGQTCIKAGCARDLKLDVRDAGFAQIAVGGKINGDAGLALISSFTLNDYEINRLNVIVVMSKSASVMDCDGCLGFDYLQLNAAILPVGAPVLLFKPGGHSAPPLDRYLEQLGYKPIALHYGRGGLHIEGRLDGLPFNAVVDSGAEFSLFDLDFVRQIKGSDIDESRMTATGVDGRDQILSEFTPKELSFGSLNIKPRKVMATKAPVFANAHVTALLGYDLLGEHQAIIDLGHDTLWMK